MLEFHRPVLLNETIALLDPKPGGVFLDATLGGGGHAAAILERTSPNGILIGIDRDPEAIEYASRRLESYGQRVKLVQGNFRDVGAILASVDIGELDGVLFDLGVSSHQLESERGFSFMRDQPLDMRMSPFEGTLSAADVVNTYSESDLTEIIRRYGEERYARRIARSIVERRKSTPIRTTGELVDTILSAVGEKYRGLDIHPATRTFQAIRIEVNKELEAVEKGVTDAIEHLKIGGRICVISFHSLEDRIIKKTFRRLSGHCECPPMALKCECGAKKILRVITKKPLTPNEKEIAENPRSRSAKLRCAERVAY
jgi:16S rRNA (cytosine1402-N4)-methyltransferase